MVGKDEFIVLELFTELLLKCKNFSKSSMIRLKGTIEFIGFKLKIIPDPYDLIKYPNFYY